MPNGPAPAWWLTGGGSQQDWDSLPPATVKSLTGSTTSKMYLPPNYVVGNDGKLYDATGNTPGSGYSPYEVFVLDGIPVTFDPTTGVRRATAAEMKAQGYDGPGGSGGGTDPAQIGYEYAKLSSDEKQHADDLTYQYQKLGMDYETARRQALADLIQSRDSLASNTANTSANVAKQIAEFAANPRDTYAEAVYRNQVGGSTPFGDTNNKAFGQYGSDLDQKMKDIFQPVAADLQKSREYRDAIPPVDFLGGQTQQIGGAGAPAASPPPASGGTDILTQMTDRLKAMSPEDQRSFREYVTGGNSPQPMAHGGKIKYGNITGSGFGSPGAFADGGSLNFDGMFDRSKEGYSPSSSEGGTNLNLHERAVVVGESGHIYATLGEQRPDGTQRAEQLQIKPLKTEVEKDKKLADAHKAVIESQKTTMKAFAEGGTVSTDDMNAQYTQLLQRLGGQGGGSSTPFGGARFLAGAPANALLNDPFLRGVTEARYSALPSLGGSGLAPEDLWAQIQKFTPQGVQGNTPRVNFA